MVAIPEVQRPPDHVIEAVEEHFRENEKLYRRIWEQLELVRTQYQTASRDEQIGMLKLSYINSVISIREDVRQHEAAFEAFVSGKPLRRAMKDQGMGLVDGEPWSKVPKVHETLRDHTMWETLADLLDHTNNGEVDTAHKLLIDQAGWLGTAKAPFTLANLGFTQKMCLDSNVTGLVRAEQPETKVVEKYEGVCADIRAMFPNLLQNLEPYELQWLLFDFQRLYRMDEDGNLGELTGTREIARHQIWFDTVLGNMDKAIEAVKKETRIARTGEPETPTKEEQITEAVEQAISTSISDERKRREMQSDIAAAVADAVNGG